MHQATLTEIHEGPACSRDTQRHISAYAFELRSLDPARTVQGSFYTWQALSCALGLYDPLQVCSFAEVT
jgi:hypothetical protein